MGQSACALGAWSKDRRDPKDQGGPKGPKGPDVVAAAMGSIWLTGSERLRFKYGMDRITNNIPAFRIDGQVAVVTGGGGVLCSTMAQVLAGIGAKVAILDLKQEAAEAVAESIRQAGGQAVGIACDVLDRSSLEAAEAKIRAELGPVDVLVNGAGGNHSMATTRADLPFFELDPGAVDKVFGLNFTGTMLACQVFGKIMAERGSGTIINISSMNAFRPLTRIPAYSAAKAAVSNFTQWLAVHMAQEYNPAIRVNAIAPGFFLTEQNRFLLTDKETGELTARGKQIIDHTPASRLGSPDDLASTLVWLVSPSSTFITGIVVPVDGGFSAYSGV